MTVLVIDVGTSNIRVSLVEPDGAICDQRVAPMPAAAPFPGLVEFDPAALAQSVLSAADELCRRGEPPSAVGITNQRASTVVWERSSGEVVGTGLGWQDLRTVMECITAKAEHGFHLAPNQSATKAAWLLDQADPSRSRDLCFGTIDSWLVWQLTGGARHVIDHTNAAVTGLTTADAESWSSDVCNALRIPMAMLPELTPTIGVCGHATALPGSPPIAALVGDQQASMAGQGCVAPGQAKITFGTGAMLDVCTHAAAPAVSERNPSGTFPIVCRSTVEGLVWGAEAIMLSAGSNVAWLCDDMGLIDTPADSDSVAAACDDTAGVVFVPALLGLGTPHWDYGARGTLLGLTRGTTRAHIVRAVLEGVAQRGADLLEAALADAPGGITTLRVDGGMSANRTFVQALANAAGRSVEVSPHLEATTVGAAYYAGLAVGEQDSLDALAIRWSPQTVVEPRAEPDRAAWRRAVERSRSWIPDLSALDF
jgi:glycerol kinase